MKRLINAGALADKLRTRKVMSGVYHEMKPCKGRGGGYKWLLRTGRS